MNGVTSRYPFDAEAVQRKAAEALPDWVYRYVSAASGDGRTQQENIDAYKRYGIIPRMMVSPPERDLSIDLFGKHFDSPIFMPPIGLVGLCSPYFQGKTLSDSMHRHIQRGPVKIKSVEYRTLRTEIAENVIPASGNSSTTSCT